MELPMKSSSSLFTSVNERALIPLQDKFTPFNVKFGTPLQELKNQRWLFKLQSMASGLLLNAVENTQAKLAPFGAAVMDSGKKFGQKKNIPLPLRLGFYEKILKK